VKGEGENITPEAIASAVKLSEETYCSVGGMLKKAVPIKSSFELVKE
jgi:uncharacterized OsmC-like protein